VFFPIENVGVAPRVATGLGNKFNKFNKLRINQRYFNQRLRSDEL
jgi:hypothetical protein